MNFRKINIITGHYGSGKTNVSVNMALDLAEKGEKVTVVDLDLSLIHISEPTRP